MRGRSQPALSGNHGLMASSIQDFEDRKLGY